MIPGSNVSFTNRRITMASEIIEEKARPLGGMNYRYLLSQPGKFTSGNIITLLMVIRPIIIPHKSSISLHLPSSRSVNKIVIVRELQKAVSEAAEAKRLAMGREEALKAFRTATVEAGIPIVAELSPKYPETQPQYAESSSVDDYYSSEGPPVVTYYPPPDYGYLYAWVPCPFFFDTFFFPGFFVLHDFHKVIIINRKVVVVTNHVTDPKTKTVALIDPVKRGTGRELMTTLNKPRRKAGHFYFGKNRSFLNWLDIAWNLC
jgi:hypothetical protein